MVSVSAQCLPLYVSSPFLSYLERTLKPPTPCCLNVVLRLIEGITAPVSSEGSDPTCMARVEKPIVEGSWCADADAPLCPLLPLALPLLAVGVMANGGMEVLMCQVGVRKSIAATPGQLRLLTCSAA